MVSISPWWVLLAAVPVLLVGEWLVKQIGVLSRFNIPAPVVGGLLVSLIVLAFNISGYQITLLTQVRLSAWNWLVLDEPTWFTRPEVDVHRPFLVGFFACIGLNASWNLVKKASWQLPLFLGICGLLTVTQNVIGVGIAKALGESPLLGLICGSISLTGGHGTALGFADVIIEAGYAQAPVVGVAAATFGLVAAGLLGGPVGGYIVRRYSLRPSENAEIWESENASQQQSSSSGIVAEVKRLVRAGRPALINLVALLVCIKLGAWVSLGIVEAGLTFPVYIGAMLVGIVIRNVSDGMKRGWIRTGAVDLLGSICLSMFLAIALMGLNLIDLASSAVVMMAILIAQVIMMALFARFITYNLMGRDYDSAVMAAGHCGFGLGATPAAVANMKALTEEHGPAPRAFLILPLVGAFLIDFLNVLVITTFLNFFT